MEAGDEDRLYGVGERGEAIGKFVPLLEVAAVDGIAVGDAFVLSAEADGEEAVVVADLDGQDFGFANFDPVKRSEVGEVYALRGVEGEACIQRDVEVAQGFEADGGVWAAGAAGRLPDEFRGVCRSAGVKIVNGRAGEAEAIEAEVL